MNESNLLEIGTSGPWGKAMKRSILGQEVKVQGHTNWFGHFCVGIILDSFGSSSFYYN